MSLTIEDPPGPLAWLQSWYALQCDGGWEHTYGVKIDTLDNPGWTLQIELHHTSLQSRSLERVTVQRDEHDWLHAWTQDETFHAACGPLNLSEAIYTFRRWAETQPSA